MVGEEGCAAMLFVVAGEANAAEELLDGTVAPIAIGSTAAAAPVVPVFAVAPRAGNMAERALHTIKNPWVSCSDDKRRYN
jgi:hypothetical protein